MRVVNRQLLLRVVATLAVAAIAAGTFEPFYIRMFFIDRAKMRASLIELPYRKAPGLRTFFLEVGQRIPPGSRVAIAAPWTDWDRGYEYVFTRAWYPLAGREMLALTRPGELERAEYIAAWHIEPVVPGFTLIWRGRDGVILRRTR